MDNEWNSELGGGLQTWQDYWADIVWNMFFQVIPIANKKENQNGAILHFV